MYRSFVPAGAGRFRIDPHVLLQRGNQVRNHLQRHDDHRTHLCADHVLGFRGMDVFFRQWQHLAEGEGEIKRGV